MVFIQSQNFDLSTNTIIEWLLHYKVPFVRANHENGEIILKKFLITNLETKIILDINGIVVDLDEISAYWHRRGTTSIKNKYNLDQFTKGFTKRVGNALLKNFEAQFHTLNEFINVKLAGAGRKLGNLKAATLNKLDVLQKASECGLVIPDTLITTSKRELQEFKNKKGRIISKSIQDSVFIPGDYEHIVHYTEEITDNMIDTLPETFAPSFFQQLGEKEYELRAFFLQGRFYSMAIFSQRDQQTSVDFRKYNDSEPSRTIPYKLPSWLEDQLRKLMDMLQLDTGSVDLIVSPAGNYYFLEINPVGQFGMVSYPCNYLIERKIAAYLANKTTP